MYIKDVYLVWTRTGKYEDAHNNIYKVCLTKESAEACAERLNNSLKEEGLYWSSKEDGDPEWSRNLRLISDDDIREKFGYIDYTGMYAYTSGPYEVEP